MRPQERHHPPDAINLTVEGHWGIISKPDGAVIVAVTISITLTKIPKISKPITVDSEEISWETRTKLLWPVDSYLVGISLISGEKTGVGIADSPVRHLRGIH